MGEIGVGVVGAGWMGHAHAQGYRRIGELWPETDRGVRLTAVADQDAVAAKAMADRYGIASSTGHWRDVVDDPSVTVVDITAPNDVHAEVAIEAARAGKTVVCEKPLARDLAETRRVVDAIREAGVLSHVGFTYHWVPGVRHIRALIDAGELGDIIHVRAWFLTDFGSDPEAPFSWRYDREIAGTGAIGDLGAHVIEMAESFAGPIDRVAATAATVIANRPDLGGSVSHFHVSTTGDAPRRAVTNDDAFVAAARFRSGALGVLEASRVVSGPRASFGIEVYGTHGSVRWDLERMNEIELYDSRTASRDKGFARIVSGPGHPDFSPLSPGAGVGLSWQDLKTIEAHHLVKSIRTGTRSEVDAGLALRVALVLDAIERSDASGAWETVAAGEGT